MGVGGADAALRLELLPNIDTIDGVLRLLGLRKTFGPLGAGGCKCSTDVVCDRGEGAAFRLIWKPVTLARLVRVGT